MGRKRGGRFSAVGMLAVLMIIPLWPLAFHLAGLRSACVDITELQFRPLPPEPGAEDPLALMQAGIQKGAEAICTDVDGYRKTVLEDEWHRITLLKVKLRDSPGTILAAIPSAARSAYDFYAVAIYEARVARRRQLLKETARTEGIILSLAALAWCGRCCYERRKRK